MIWVFLIFMTAVSITLIIMGAFEEGPWYERGINHLWKVAKRKGMVLPGWLTQKTAVRTWILMSAGSLLLAGWEAACIFMDSSEVTQIERPAYGEGARQEELEMEWEEKDGTVKKDEVMVEVDEKKLTKEEKKKIFHEVKEQLGQVILGENKSADHVDKPLKLPEKLDGLPAAVSWYSSDPQSVDWEGSIGNDIPVEGRLLCLTAAISLQGEEEMYYQYVKVFPAEQNTQNKVQKLLEEENEKDKDIWLQLPAVLDDKKLVWKKSRKSMRYALILLVAAVPLLLLVKDKQEAQEKKKQQRQQMIQDYPEILSKLTLLLSAGVNLRKAMERISKDYMKRKNNGEYRKAYEVIVDICTEMETGISEKEAYEKMGERCELIQYRTLSALLVQHLQKGSRGMEQMLEEEASKAQQLRQQQARILGEQASTKLLIPMIMMLLVVFVILLVPAWLSFTL
jgi:tight adherence protein C